MFVINNYRGQQYLIHCFILFRYDGYWGPPPMGPPRGRGRTGMRPGRGNNSFLFVCT